MSELSREQVERECQWLVEEHCGSAAKKWLATDAALRATITQQAQELERVKKLMKEREYRDEANATLQLQILADKAKRIDDLKQQLSASQARCRDMEREIESLTTCGCEGCDDNLEESAFCLPCMNKVQQQVTQLQATLAAREARIAELVEGLRTIAYADWSPELNKEISAAMERGELKHMTGVEWLAQRLLTQLEAHRKEG